MVKIKRAYEKTEKTDGYRVLVDRLWPRGIKKSSLRLDDWIKDLAPSTELRKAFAHDPSRWDWFQERYEKELRSSRAREILTALLSIAKRGPLTLVYSARDEEHNNAVVLKDLLDRRLKSSARKAA